MPIFDHAHQISITLTFIPFILSWYTANFRVLWPQWPHPFLDTSAPTFSLSFKFSWIYKTMQKITISLFSSDIFNLKILQSDWPRAFWPISQKSNFFQIWNLNRNTANNINFHYRSNSQNITNKISQKIKTHIFGRFLGARLFHNIRLCYKQLRVSKNMPQFRKNYLIPRKRLEDGRNEGPILFLRTYPFTVGVSKK